MLMQPQPPQDYPAAAASGRPRIAAVNAHIGSRLAQCRQAQNLTTDDLGRRIGVSGARLSDYENGVKEIPASTLLSLAEAMRVSVEYFYDDLT